MGKSLRASEQGLIIAKRAFQRLGLTQQEFAEQISVKTCYSIRKFFKGELIASRIFQEICEQLRLDWEEIAAPEPTNMEALVGTIREKVHPYIQQRCGTMRVLDMTQPVGLIDIYTNVNLLKQITGDRRLTIAQFLKEFDPDLSNFDHFGFSRITEKRIPGRDAVLHYPKLMVLGKPGSGKTTFLKYLAIQCNSGEFLAHLVPIFVTLRDLAESKNQLTCLDFITQLLSHSGVIETQITQVIEQGRAFILLDGLDEVREEDVNRVIKEIHAFSDQYHMNQFVITCRIAAREYTFDKFTDVEIADFNDQQIKTFTTKWLQAKDADIAERFMEQLNSNPPIKELATNPLLLTLLCLEFEDAGDFPSDRAELYKRGIDTLLRKWDTKRGIVRDQVYKKLSVQRKKDLLSQFALTAFERKDYFFKQRELQQYIANFIRNLPDAQTDPEALDLDSEAVLKSIEAQHGLLVERARGIYSFSHLTFQEYFTARKIVNSSEPQALENALQTLVSHITEKRWREVFLLTVGMLQPADYLLQLIKHQVDALLTTDEKLQEFLDWIAQKALSVQVPYEPITIRAFYFDLVFDHHARRYRDFNLLSAIDRHLYILVLLGYDRTLDLGLDDILSLACDRALALVLGLTNSPYAFKSAFFLACDRADHLDSTLGKALQLLQQKLPDPSVDDWNFKQWWRVHGLAWTEQLADAMVEHRNIGHNWQFTQQQYQLLKQYHYANRLLIECLHRDCYISREVRSHIEQTLLLPVLEREHCNHY